MGARGQLKLANHLHSVPAATKGTAAAEVSPLAPRKPSEVESDPALSAAWDIIVPGLDAAGLLSESDLPSLVLALMHYVVASKAYRQIGGEVVVEDHHNSGVKKNPAEAVLRAESEMFLKYAQQLGMTFVSRARTPSVKGEADEPNPFAATGS